MLSYLTVLDINSNHCLETGLECLGKIFHLNFKTRVWEESEEKDASLAPS